MIERTAPHHQGEPGPITVLIPAYNEADLIGDTVRAARMIHDVVHVVVIDDGSTDGTVVEATVAGADQVVSLPANRGKGAALRAGRAETQGNIVVMIDGDLGASARDAFRLVGPVLEGQADMSIATLPRTGKGGGFGLAVGLARWGIRALTGRAFNTPLSGQRCLTRAVTDACDFEDGFGVETALTIDALRAGFRLVEVDTVLSHRVTGRSISGMLHRLRQFRDIAWTLLRRTVRRSSAGRS